MATLINEIEHFKSAAMDDVIGEWSRVLPEADLSAKEIIGRISRLYMLITFRIQQRLSKFDLSDTEFRALAGLRRSGPPFRLAPSELSPRYISMTSGGLTSLVDRLEARDLVKRESNPHDGRGVLVSLTAKGRVVAEEAMSAVAETETSIVARLTSAEQKAQRTMLKTLMRAAEEGLL